MKYCLTLFAILISLSSFSQEPTSDEVNQMATSFLNRKNHRKLLKLKNAQIQQVKEIKPVEVDGQVIFHVAELKPKGFVILSNDKNIEPVIAYSESSNFSFNKNSDNTLHRLLVDDLVKRKDSSLKKIDKWGDKLLQLKSTSTDEFQQWPEEGSTVTGGWIETTWHQSAPYNNFCPNDPETKTKVPAGCTPIALAQITNYYKYLSNIYFSEKDRYTTFGGINIDKDSTLLDFPSFNEVNKEVQNIKTKYASGTNLNEDEQAMLCFIMGLALQVEYNLEGTAAFVWPVKEGFIGKFGYYNVSEIFSSNQNFWQALKQDVISSRPSYITMPGHSLVLDGFNTENFFHINFGWGENSPDNISDAWYRFPDKTPSERWSFIDYAFTNILPNKSYSSELYCDKTIINLESKKIDDESNPSKLTIRNDGSEIVHITTVSTHNSFELSKDGNNYGVTINDFDIKPNESIQLFVRCNANQIGYNSGNIFIETSLPKHNKVVELNCYVTEPTGTIINSGDVFGVWDSIGSPYLICGNINVKLNHTLSIKPGTNIKFLGNYKLRVNSNSQLKAIGTVEDPILFYPNDTIIGWGGIRFYESESDDNLSYCHMSGVINMTPESGDNEEGGAIQIIRTNPLMSHCALFNNKANRGAGVFIHSDCSPVLRNMLIFNNYAGSGGAISNSGASISIINCTITDNHADRKGGGIFHIGDFIMKNSILFGNTALNSGSEIYIHNYSQSNSPYRIEFSNIDTTKNNWLVNDSQTPLSYNHHVICKDPKFEATSIPFGLSINSPCIDEGDPNDDIRNEFFPHGFRINLGAYGGTINAQKTMDGVLTVVPNPINFGNIKQHTSDSTYLYLKNGTTKDFEITNIKSFNDSVFFIKEYSLPRILSSGDIDSLEIKFHPKDNLSKSYNSSLEISGNNFDKMIIDCNGTARTGTDIRNELVSGIWTKEGSPYNIYCDIRIPNGKKLRIKEGVEVEFMGKYGVSVGENASISAIGSIDEPITFHSEDTTSFWKGFSFNNSASDDSLIFCNIAYCEGYEGGAIYIKSSSPTINHCKIHDCYAHYGSAIYVDFDTDNTSNIVVQNILMHHNNGGALMIFLNDSPITIKNVTITSNVENLTGFGIISSSANCTIQNSIIWDNTSTFGNIFSIAQNVKLSINHSNIDTTNSSWRGTNYDYLMGEIVIGSHVTCLDPQFNNPDLRDFTLKNTSACIDGGNPIDAVKDEIFPHGYRINMGVYGGTKYAAKSSDYAFTVSPNPVDFGYQKEDKTKTIYLKNGGLKSVKVGDVRLSISTCFSLGSSSNILSQEIILNPGEIDSFVVSYDFNISENGTNKTNVIISTKEVGELSIPISAIKKIGTDINDTNVSGEWTKEKSPYYIHNDISVTNGRTLKIGKGVTLYFMGKFKLLVGNNSNIIANGTRNDSIIFTSINPDVTWSGLYLNNSGNNDSLSFCKFESFKTNGFDYCCLGVTNCSPYISNCHFNNNIANAGGWIIGIWNSSVQIDNCILDNNQGVPIWVFTNSNLRLYNSLIYGNISSRGGALFIEGSANVEIINSTIVKNEAQSDGGAIFSLGNNELKICNSIIYNNIADRWLNHPNETGSSISTNFDVISIDHSIIESNKGNWYYEQTAGGSTLNLAEGNLSDNPLFKDVAKFNFHLTQFSPGIDAGVNSNLTESDQEGRKRIWDGNNDGLEVVDIGCYEFGAPLDSTNIVSSYYSLLNENTYLFFLIYPNPNDGKFRLRFENGKSDKYQVQVINELGQVQVNREIYMNGSVYEEEFELSHLPKGNYFVKVFDGEKSNTKKVILN